MYTCDLPSTSVIKMALSPLTPMVPVVTTVVRSFKLVLSTVTVWSPPDTP